jgi:hypothetical protein
MSTPDEPKTAAGRQLWQNLKVAFDTAPRVDGNRRGRYPVDDILAIEVEASRIDVPPETEAVRRCVTHHACACHERLAEIGRRYIKAYEAEP